MRAAIFNDKKSISVEDRDMPVCGSEDVVVRNMRASICGSDVTAYLHGGDKMGMRNKTEFGHEMAGIVHAVGADVRDIPVGMRVFVEPILAMGIPQEAMMAGGFSQYTRVRKAELNRNIYELPDSLSFDEAALIEPFAVATHGKNRAKAQPHEKVLVIGAGPIGQFALASLIAQGNKTVAVLDIVESRLKAAENLGCAAYNSSDPLETENFLGEYFGILPGKNTRITPTDKGYAVARNDIFDIDVVIDCAGIPSYLDMFMRHAKPMSRFTCIAVYKQPVTMSFHEIMSTQCAIMGSKGYEQKDILEVIDNLLGKTTPVTNTITHTFPLEEISRAFEKAAAGGDALKVVINME